MTDAYSYAINARALQVKSKTQTKSKETDHLGFQPERAFLHMYTDFLQSLFHASRHFLTQKVHHTPHRALGPAGIVPMRHQMPDLFPCR